jgi:hypothetical protein
MTFEKALKQVNCPRRLFRGGLLKRGRRAQNRSKSKVFKAFNYAEGLHLTTDSLTSYCRSVYPISYDVSSASGATERCSGNGAEGKS